MRIKKFIGVFCLLGGMISLQAADTVLVLQLKSGRAHTFYLSNQPEVTFEGNRLVINAYNQKEDQYTVVDYLRDDVDDFHFVDAAASIEEVKATDLRFVHVQNDMVCLSGLTQDDFPLLVFDMQGKQCPADISLNGSEAQISLANLSKGFYLIQIGKQQTIKIIKR